MAPDKRKRKNPYQDLPEVNINNDLSRLPDPNWKGTPWSPWYKFDFVDPAHKFILRDTDPETWEVDEWPGPNDTITENPSDGPPVSIELYRCAVNTPRRLTLTNYLL